MTNTQLMLLLTGKGVAEVRIPLRRLSNYYQSRIHPNYPPPQPATSAGKLRVNARDLRVMMSPARAVWQPAQARPCLSIVTLVPTDNTRLRPSACTFLGTHHIPLYLSPLLLTTSSYRSEFQARPSEGLHSRHRAEMASGGIDPGSHPIINRSASESSHQQPTQGRPSARYPGQSGLGAFCEYL
jgi:hypothetical protein